MSTPFDLDVEARARAIVARERARAEAAEARARAVVDVARERHRVEEAGRAETEREGARDTDGSGAVPRVGTLGDASSASRVRPRPRSCAERRASAAAEERRRARRPAEGREAGRCRVRDDADAGDADAGDAEAAAATRAGREPRNAALAVAAPAEASGKPAKQERYDRRAHITEARADVRRMKKEVAAMERFVMCCIEDLKLRPTSPVSSGAW